MSKLFTEARKGNKHSQKPDNFGRLILGEVPFTISEGPRPSETKESHLTEKQIVLEAFTSYAKEKIEEDLESKTLNFNGGEIKLKEATGYRNSFALNLKTPIESAVKEKAKVIFLFDEERNSEFSGLEKFTDKGLAELFLKMVTDGMKLSSPDYDLTSIFLEDKTSNLNTLISKVLAHKPKMIISLGAKATNSLLETNLRMAELHGKFFDLSFKSENEDHVLKLMPILSLDIINISKDKKRIVWEDLKKAIQYLGNS